MKASRLLGRVFACAAIVACCVGVAAADPSDAQAATLTAGNPVVATTNGGDVEYTYHTPDSGRFHIEFTILSALDEDSMTTTGKFYGVDIELWANYKRYEYGVAAYEGGTFEFGNYSFAPGTDVTVKLLDFDEDCIGTYKIAVVPDTPKNYESESNDTQQTADSIDIGTVYNGTYIEDDEDWYTFTAPKTGAYRVSTVITGGGDTGIDADVLRGFEVATSWSFYYGEGWTPSDTIVLSKGEQVHIRIYENYSWLSNFDYSVKVEQLPGPATPAISKAKLSKHWKRGGGKYRKSLKIAWKRAARASGYQVRVTGKLKIGKKIKRINIKKRVSSKKWTLKIAGKKKPKGKLTVSVRSYKSYSGKKVWSSWSTAKKVKVK